MLRIHNHNFRSNSKNSPILSKFSHFSTHFFHSIHQELLILSTFFYSIHHSQVIWENCLKFILKESCKFIHCANLELPWQLKNPSSSCIVELSIHHHSSPTSSKTICFTQFGPNTHGFNSCTSRR
jgi:hypothetical protein